MLASLLGSLFASQQAAAFQSWIERRDAGVVRQQYDTSCGAAALATLLSYYYLRPTSERDVLERLLEQQKSSALSFADLARLANSFGFGSMGIAVPLKDLARLQQPVIVALETAGRAHFSLIRGVNKSGGVMLADPSWGNRWIARHELASLIPGEKPRILLIGDRARHRVSPDYFHRSRASGAVPILPSGFEAARSPGRLKPSFGS